MSARATAALAVIAVVTAFSSYAIGCATEETLLFADPAACIAGRCLSGATSGSGSSSSGGTDCTMPDAGCAISWKTDIFDPILDGTAKCSDMACHGDPSKPEGDFLLPKGDAAAGRDAVLNYAFDSPPGPYVTCGMPTASKFLCNMFLGPGVMNKHGKCGTLMPDLLNDPTAMALTEMQLDMIAEWIACGAPNN